MINIPQDLFVRMAISAKKLKIKEEKKEIPALKKLQSGFSQLEQTDYSEIKSDNMGRAIMSGAKPSIKIEDRITSIVKNPVMIELKSDIESAESLWNNIKTSIDNKETISRINNKIHELRRTIYEKSYV